MSLTDLSSVLWRSRELLELLLFKLEEEQLLLAANRSRWLAHATREVEVVLDRLIAEDRLRIRAGRLTGIAADEAGLIVTWAPRGRTARREVFDRVILTTGPAHDRIIAGSPVLSSAAAQGLLRADALGLGLDVTEGCRAVGATGAAVDGLWVAGPLARGHVGELMGIPEVTAHAERVASHVAAALQGDRRAAGASVREAASSRHG